MSATRCNRFNSSSRSRLSRRFSGFALWRYESRKIYYIAINAADNAKTTAQNGAAQTYQLALNTATSVYNLAAIDSETSRITNDSEASYDRVTRLMDSYFGDLLDECAEISTAHGQYYSDSITAIQNNFDANATSSESLDGALLGKAVSYTNSLINTETSLNTSILNAVFGYTNATSATTFSTTAESHAEIDAKVAYYTATQNAKAAATKKNIKASHDAMSRQINFLASWAQASNSARETAYPTNPSSNISVASNGYYYGYYGYYSHYYYGYYYDYMYGYGPYGYGPYGLYDWYYGTGESAEVGTFYDGRATSFANVSLNNSLWTGNPWQQFSSANGALLSAKLQSAHLGYEAAEASAKHTYLTTYAALYNDEIGDELDNLESEFTAAINAGRSLNTGLWNAAQGANTSIYRTTRQTDTTGNILNYLSSSVSSSISLSTSLVNYFGDFQNNWRSDRLASGNVTSRSSQYMEDQNWSTNMVAARDSYYNLLGSSINDYNDTVFDELGNYAEASLDALITKSTDYFAANREYSESSYDSMAEYQSAQFAAAKDQAQSYLDAAITELLANSEAEKTAKEERRNNFDEAFTVTQEDLDAWGQSDDTGFNVPNFDTSTEEGKAAEDAWYAQHSQKQEKTFEKFIQKSPAAVATLQNLNTQQTAIQTAMDNAIAAAKTANQNIRESSEDEADEAYNLATRLAYNTYVTTNAEIETTFKTSTSAADLAYDAAISTATANFDATTLEAQTSLEITATALIGRFGQAIQIINNGGIYESGYLENENIELKVCFVAGTPVLMADGTTKPIEQIRPGDMVLAVDHNAPEEKPTAARVLTFFDNGLKSVIKLIFDNQKTGEQLEVECTPEHPFYVEGKGWTPAGTLTPGDTCRNANGEPITFTARENLQAPQNVYNFEVEEKHTYFVGIGNTNSVLVHNICKKGITSSRYTAENLINLIQQKEQEHVEGFNGYYLMFFARTGQSGHAWVGIYNSHMNESKIIGISPESQTYCIRDFVPAILSDHTNESYDGAGVMALTEKTYNTIKNNITFMENNRNAIEYNARNFNCVDFSILVATFDVPAFSRLNFSPTDTQDAIRTRNDSIQTREKNNVTRFIDRYNKQMNAQYKNTSTPTELLRRIKTNNFEENGLDFILTDIK